MKLNKLLMVAVATLGLSGLASCGGEPAACPSCDACPTQNDNSANTDDKKDETPAKATLTERYTYSITGGTAKTKTDADTGEVTASLSSASSTQYILDLYSDSTYQFNVTSGSFGYSMNLSMTSTTTWGTFTKASETDGYVPVTLSAPTEAVVTMVVYLNNTDVNINTQNPYQTYPVELPAKAQGEKNMAEDKAAVLAYAGSEVTYYLDENHVLHLENPAA